MSKLTKQFSVDDLAEIRKDGGDGDDFFIAKIGFLSSGDNFQKCPISVEVLEKYAPTILGKFVTAKYDYWSDDVKSHEDDLDIIGYIPRDSEITYNKLPDGRTMAYCEAVLSKIYCYDVYKLFKAENFRSVSVEFSCNLIDPNEFDEGEISSFNIHSVTILGKNIPPAIKDASIKIMKFSSDKANDYYNEYLNNPLKKFAEKRKTEMKKSYGKKDEKGKEQGMKDAKKFSVDIGNLWSLIWDMLALKYPDKDYGSIYRIKGVYEDGGNKFAIIYRKDETTTYKLDFTLNDGNIDFSEEIIEVEETFVEKDTVKMFSVDGEEKYTKFSEESIIMEDEDNRTEETKEEDEIEKKLEDDSEEEEDKDEHEDEKHEDEKDESEKKFSLNAYVDATALLALLEDETEERKVLADEVLNEMGADKLFSCIMELSKENEDLKKFKASVEDEERKKKFKSIMANAKEDLSEKTFSELKAEGEVLPLSKLDAFENKVKAFAYDGAKARANENSMRFSFGNERQDIQSGELSADEIYNKYLNN